MNAPRDPDLILADWLDDGPTRLPDQTRRAIEVGLRSTTQRRSIIGWPWRSDLMNPTLKIAAGATAMVLVAAVGLSILAPAGGIGGPPPSPSPTASPTPSATPAAAAGTVPFTSARYGYDLSVPAGWKLTPSTRAWTMAQDQHDWLSPGSDQFRAPANSLLFTVFAAPIPAGTSGDAWIEAYAVPATPPPPGASPSPLSEGAACTLTPVDLGVDTVDGHPVSFRAEPNLPSCGGTSAFVPVGNRMYVLSVWLPGKEAILTDFLQSVRFPS
jgi:hypothetical protein